MKRFIVFYFNDYEAMGGMYDAFDSTDTLEEAIALCQKIKTPTSEVQIFDCKYRVDVIFELATN